MFLNKWTLQFAAEGENEELSFSSKEEAIQRAEQIFNEASAPASIALIDPDTKREVLDGPHKLQMAASA